MLVELQFAPVLEQWRSLFNGACLTIIITGIGAVLGVMLGICCARCRVSGGLGARTLVGSYVELVRNTPFIVQLYFIFFGLPVVGLKLDPNVASIIAVVVNIGAYSTEIIRAGIEATPRGQLEAARSLALTERQTFIRVVLPPALKRVWHPLVGQIVIVMLGTAVCSQISSEELSYQAYLIQSRNFRAFETFIVAAVIYLTMAGLLRKFLNWLGPRFIFGRGTC